MSISSLLSRRYSKPKGFTLIELLVVVAIIVIITATLLVRQARFDSSTLLRSLSYSVALSVRSAQVYGTSVRIASGASGAPAYGVHFDNATSYLLYADTNGNGVYNLGTDAVVQTYQIGGGFRISKFCATPLVGAQQCWLLAGGGTLTWLDVYFKRPNSDGLFATSAGGTYSTAQIQISAINDPTNTHSITITSTGQIAVGAAGS